MTEPIIINGVDVSGCIYYDKDEYYTCLNDGNVCNCEEDSKCYYKQLQRKTAECEELEIKLMQKSEVDMFFNTPIEGWSNGPCGVCSTKHKLQIATEALKFYADTFPNGNKNTAQQALADLRTDETAVSPDSEQSEQSG